MAMLALAAIGAITYLLWPPTSESAFKEIKDETKDAVSPSDMPLEDTSPDSEHRFGDPKAKVILTVFGDYQCPYTVSGMNYLKTVVSQYSNGVVLIYHHFPLESIHANARLAASATEAAALQSKFWPMSNLIFAEYETWSDQDIAGASSTFEGYAKTLGLDMDRYRSDVDSSSVRAKIDKDLAWAEKLKLNGTPSVFLNGAPISLDQVYDAGAFNKAIGAKLKR